jgi:hypothetical protein
MLALSLIAPPALLGLVLTMHALESRLLGRPEVGDWDRTPEASAVNGITTSHDVTRGRSTKVTAQ